MARPDLLQLPFDVLDTLAARFLSVDEMKACSLTSWAFRDVVKEHIQRNVVLRYDLLSKTDPAGERIRSDIPLMATRIRRLFVHCNALPKTPRIECAISDQLPAMVNLGKIVFTGDGLAYDRLDLSFRLLYMIASRAYPTLSSVRSLVLHRLPQTVPVELFGTFPMLDSLTLVGIKLGGFDSTTSVQQVPTGLASRRPMTSCVQTHQRPVIRNLTIALNDRRMIDFVRWACGGTAEVDFTRMRSLRLSVAGYHDTISSVCDIFLPICGEDLETLDLHLFGSYIVTDGGRDIPPMFTIAQYLPNLKTLRVQPETIQYSKKLGVSVPGFSSWLPRFIHQFKDCPQLTRMEVFCSFRKDALLELRGTRVEERQWSEDVAKLWKDVDEAFSGVRTGHLRIPSSSTSSPSLKRLSFHMAEEDDDVNRAAVSLYMRLPKLHHCQSACWVEILPCRAKADKGPRNGIGGGSRSALFPDDNELLR